MVLRVNNRRTYAKTLVKKDTVIDLTKEKTTISSLSSELLQIPNSKMIKKKLSAEERVGSARQRLQIASIPSRLPCREKEVKHIATFIKNIVSSKTRRGGSLYLSGIPGTGKTSAVRQAITDLKETKNLPLYDLVPINGMRLTNPGHAYSQIWSVVSGSKKNVTPSKACQLLDEYFQGGKGKAIIIIVDELDMLITKSQDVVYTLFEWPQLQKCSCGVIGIANTMDLPERMLPRVDSRLGLDRVIFGPYTVEQLKTIIMNRITGLNIFEDDAVELCSRKVASVSGDARRGLEVCRRAVEVVGEGKKVTMKDINAVIKNMTSSCTSTALKTLPLHGKLLVVAIHCIMARLNTMDADIEEVFSMHGALSRRLNLTDPLSTSVILNILSTLVSQSLVYCEPAPPAYPRKLSVAADEIFGAYGDDERLSTILRELPGADTD